MRPAPIDRRKIKILRVTLRRKFYAAIYSAILLPRVLDRATLRRC